MANVDRMRSSRPATKIDTDLEHFPSFSSGGNSSCPSLTSSFMSTGSSPLALDNSRRLSVDSTDSFAFETFSPHYPSGTVSPTTPLTSSDLVDTGFTTASSMMCMPADLGMSQLYHQDSNEPYWMSQDSKAMNVMSPMEHLEGQHSFSHGHIRSYLPSQAHHLHDSTLSRPIFHGSSPYEEYSQDSLFPWTPTVHSTPPQTVAPSATFHPALSSPHGLSLAPATPSPLRYHGPSTPTLKSSPMSPYSPSNSFSSSISSVYHAGEALHRIMDSRGQLTPCKPSRKTVRRHEQYKVTKSRSFSPPPIVKANMFKCDREDCVDKEGRRKAFKRSEHLKRHINTCHSGKRDHVCWVDGCKKPFSRSDNLKTHMYHTHGRKSSGQRNRYVATLDDKSPYYEPDYRGPLDSEGRPLKIKAERNE